MYSTYSFVGTYSVKKIIFTDISCSRGQNFINIDAEAKTKSFGSTTLLPGREHILLTTKLHLWIFINFIRTPLKMFLNAWQVNQSPQGGPQGAAGPPPSLDGLPSVLPILSQASRRQQFLVSQDPSEKNGTCTIFLSETRTVLLSVLFFMWIRIWLR